MISPTIIASLITAGSTLVGVVVTNELQLRRQDRRITAPAPKDEASKETAG